MPDLTGWFEYVYLLPFPSGRTLIPLPDDRCHDGNREPGGSFIFQVYVRGKGVTR